MKAIRRRRLPSSRRIFDRLAKGPPPFASFAEDGVVPVEAGIAMSRTMDFEPWHAHNRWLGESRELAIADWTHGGERAAITINCWRQSYWWQRDRWNITKEPLLINKGIKFSWRLGPVALDIIVPARRR